MALQMQTRARSKVDVVGLTPEQVAVRVRRGDVNDFEARSGRSYLVIIQQNMFNIFNLLLFTLLLIVLFSGDFWTVLFAGFSVVTNSLIGTVQEIQAKRKLDELANLAPKQVQVLRGDDLLTLDYRAVVVDDVVYLQPGDKLVVDGEIVYSDGLEIDESHLTGESEPVHKPASASVASGSFCVAGVGYMRATRVGSASTANRLTSIAKVYKNTLTPTQKKIAAVVKLALVVLFVFGPMSVVAGIMTDIGFIETVKNAVVFTTSLVPQGLILTSILALSIGAIKISRHQTLIQRVNAVESMANVSVLCFDKTGTITQNRLQVSHIMPLSAEHDRDAIDADLRLYVANLAHLNSTASALSTYAEPDAEADYPAKKREIPFTSARKWGALVFADAVLVLGAPEVILPDDHPAWAAVDEQAADGRRLLVFGRSRAELSADNPLDREQIEPVALIAISDQVRDDIGDTLASFIALGVRPKVISGDNLKTVVAVARRAGMDTSSAYTGEQIDAMSDEELAVAVKQADVFARVTPDAKGRIISALRAGGEYVAMVGDGVNDVPALKAADLAVVMNDGAQIAKDVADIVLLNNAMSTLPRAFAEGTQITQTLYGTMKVFVTKNVYNTVLFIFVLFMGLSFPVTPRQISWASFGTVNIPSGLMALGLLRPRRIESFRRDVLDYIITAGLTGAVGMAAVYVIVSFGSDELMVARSAITLFFILYSLTIFWYACGVDITRPRTYRKYPLATAITGFLTGGTLVMATIFPHIFEFDWPPLIVIALVVATWALVSMIVSIGMRNRALLHNLYELMEVKSKADRNKNG
ncbi:MAG: HAD family hydrolase [Anaerolineaceae bacterium]|nr:MAG: HAD family hydrolase [Anaerolineaceae bacterium]